MMGSQPKSIIQPKCGFRIPNIQSWEKELMRENVNPWDYRYARSIPTKRKVFEFGYVYNICNLLMVLKPLIYSRQGSEREKLPPRPPNRACGSPAHGSPVGGFLIGIGAQPTRAITSQTSGMLTCTFMFIRNSFLKKMRVMRPGQAILFWMCTNHLERKLSEQASPAPVKTNCLPSAKRQEQLRVDFQSSQQGNVGHP